MDYPKNSMLGRQTTILIQCNNQLMQVDIRKVEGLGKCLSGAVISGMSVEINR